MNRVIKGKGETSVLQYAHPSVLVDTQWLENQLDNPNLRIIEVDMSPQAYKNAHIPGAVFWNILADLLLPDLKINFDAIAFQKLLARSGINHDTTVIASNLALTFIYPENFRFF